MTTLPHGERRHQTAWSSFPPDRSPIHLGHQWKLIDGGKAGRVEHPVAMVDTVRAAPGSVLVRDDDRHSPFPLVSLPSQLLEDRESQQ